MESTIEKNPFQRIEFFPAVNKYGVTAAKPPYKQILALFDTLDDAISARNAMDHAKSLRNRTYETATR